MINKFLQFSYDERADILYISIGDPVPSSTIELGCGVLQRFNPKSKELTGWTILSFRNKLENWGKDSGSLAVKTIESIVEICNTGEHVHFEGDWGGPSLTIEMSCLGHTHIGLPIEDGGSIGFLINQLHNLLVKGEGLSFVKKDNGQNE